MGKHSKPPKSKPPTRGKLTLEQAGVSTWSPFLHSAGQNLHGGKLVRYLAVSPG